MIELQGKYSMAKVFTNNIESETISQITNLLDQDFVKNAKVRIMPDCHKGAGCVIGFTANLGDKVIPNLVGVDIGCFVGDTKIPLLNGTQKTLEQLYEEGKEFWVYSVNKDKKIVNGKAKALKTIRNAELVKVTISGGEEIICTPDHEIMLRNGKYKQAKDLKYKDSLMPLYRTYQTRDGYESLLQPNKNMKTQPTHRIVAEEYFGNIPEGYVVHHKNGNQFDNTPENLKLLTIDEHSTIHGKSSNQVTRLRSPEFKQKRLQVLQEKGFYDDKYYNKKKRNSNTEYNKLHE